MQYRGKCAVVTGGLGFVGSNLAIRLVELGARVTIIDSSVAGCGANEFNIAPIQDRVELIRRDIGEGPDAAGALESADVVFNMAGEVSHIHSMRFPERDLEINTLAQLRFLQTCARAAPGIRVVYAGTRQVYGVPEYLPVDERHPVNPVDFNGVHKYSAAMYHLMLSRAGQLDAVVLRFTNIYGPRMALDIPCQGFLGAYLRRTVQGQRLAVFGDGRQLRDPVFIDDATDAILAAGAADPLPSRSYNVGGGEVLSLFEIAQAFAAEGGCAEPEIRKFPEDRKAIDIGSYHTDATLIREQLGWRPKVGLREGLRSTLEYYRLHGREYFDPAVLEPSCKLGHGDRVTEEAAVRAVPAVR